MTTATITELELLRTRVSGAVGRQMPQHCARLGWDAGRLAALQRDRLRALLARAIAGSPFHAGRLRGVVHPFVIGAPLLHAPAVREFQIRQTERGADIVAVTDADFDPSAIVAAVGRSLRQAGLTRPQVGFRRVGALDRDPMTSKARRFIPLSVRSGAAS